MKWLVGSVVGAWVLCCQAEQGELRAKHRIHVVSYVNNFLVFYDAVKDLPLEQKLARWDSEYENLNPVLFRQFLYKREPKEDSLRKAFSKFPESIGYIAAVGSKFTSLIQRNLKVLEMDFAKTDIDMDVYALVGDFSLGGMATEFQGRPTVIVCPEMHGDADGLERLTLHEMFHAFHYKTNARIEGDQRLAAWILSEGLATYYESVHGPGWSPSKVVPYEEEAAREWLQRVRHSERELLRRLSQDLEKTDHATRVKWIGLKSTDKFIPPLSGYYLGYLISKDLLRHHSLGRVTELKGRDLMSSVRAAITHIAAGPDH